MTLPADPETLTTNQAARRDRMLQAAMKLAADGGYDAVQMRDVASEARVALGTIYRYFSSKDHLLAACQVQWSGDLQRRLTQKPPRGETPWERVGDIARRAVRAMEREPKMAAALLTAISSPDPEVVQCQRESIAIVVAVLRSAMEGIPPERQQDAVRVLEHVWFASLLGWVNGWTPASAVGDEMEHATKLLLS